MQLKRKFKAIILKATPSRRFKRELWVELSHEFTKEYPGLRIGWRRVALASVSVFAVIVMTGTGSYAYASPEVTQRHILYPVKTGIEAIEGKMHTSPEGEIMFHTRMMQRRLDEGEVMIDRQMEGGYIEPIETEMFFVISNFEEDIDPETAALLFIMFEEQHRRFGDMTQQMVERGSCGGYTPDMVRNKMEHTRVRISESDLTEEEKRALLEMIQLQPVNN